MDELKAKCKQMGIKIVPYKNANCDELKIKRERDEDVVEPIVKRMKTDESKTNGRLENGKLENGRLENDKLSNDKLVVDDCKLDDDKMVVGGKTNGCTNYYLNNNNNDNPESIKIVLRSLENFRNLERRLDFYNQMNQYENELNRVLTKYNNKPVIVRNRVDLQLPPKFNYVDGYKLDQLDEVTLKALETNIPKCMFSYPLFLL